jgi:hypothetical protein
MGRSLILGETGHCNLCLDLGGSIRMVNEIETGNDKRAYSLADDQRAGFPFLNRVRNVCSRWPVLSGMGEVALVLVLLTWIPSALLFSIGIDSPLHFICPSLAVVIPLRNGIRRQWFRLAGNVVGLLVGGPIALAGMVLMGFALMGMHPV